MWWRTSVGDGPGYRWGYGFPILLITVTLVVHPLGGSMGSFGQVSLTEELVLRYDLDRSFAPGQTVPDTGPAGNDGVYRGEPLPRSYDAGSPLPFSNETGYVSVDLVRDELAGNFTVVARVRNPRQEQYTGIVASDPWMLIAVEDEYGFIAGDGSVAFERPDRGEWYHLAAVHRAGTVHLYVDGRVVGSTRASVDVRTRRILIGRRPSGYPFEGRISEVRVYDRALSTEEVRGVYAGKRSIRPALYSDGFRAVSPIGLLLVATLAAALEIRLHRP